MLRYISQLMEKYDSELIRNKYYFDKYIDLINYHYTKSFDTVNHNKFKVIICFICGNLLNWILSFISNRRQWVRLFAIKILVYHLIIIFHFILMFTQYAVKGNSILNQVFIISRNKNIFTLIIVYKSYCRSILEYCSSYNSIIYFI